MFDRFSRNIDYIRISVTDRCNLRCSYCMPDSGVKWIPKDKILSYEEIIRFCRTFVGLGITNFRITGGEPLVRKDIPFLISEIKNISGVRSVYITTNGVLLEKHLSELINAGVDGINISLDTLDEMQYAKITGRNCFSQVIQGLNAAMSVERLNLKLNCVIIPETDFCQLAELARNNKISVRFIELMPIGLGRNMKFFNEEYVVKRLESEFGRLIPCNDVEGNGPCRYYRISEFDGRVGFISALSHKFCNSCNRVRLTANGYLKTCLQYETGIDLSQFLSCSDSELCEVIRDAIFNKPSEHHFSEKDIKSCERNIMSRIGG